MTQIASEPNPHTEAVSSLMALAYRSNFRSRNNNEEVRTHLKNRVSSLKTGKYIDYGREAEVFNTCYFAKNLFKCFHSLVAAWPIIASRVSSQRNFAVYDIGCGVGTFSLAASQYFEYLGEGSRFDLTLVDHSSKQLSLAREKFFGDQTHCQFKEVDFADCSIRPSSLILMSFAACENLGDERFFQALNVCISEECVVLVVDFAETIEELALRLPCKKYLRIPKHSPEDIDSSQFSDIVQQNIVSLWCGVFINGTDCRKIL